MQLQEGDPEEGGLDRWVRPEAAGVLAAVLPAHPGWPPAAPAARREGWTGGAAAGSAHIGWRPGIPPDSFTQNPASDTATKSPLPPIGFLKISHADRWSLGHDSCSCVVSPGAIFMNSVGTG